MMLTACGQRNEESLGVVGDFGTASLSAEGGDSNKSKYLAYTHNLSVELEANQISVTFQALVSACSNDGKFECTLMHSNLSDGEYPSASIKLRVLPEGIAPLVTIASDQGKVKFRQTSAEDLQDKVVDTQKRLEMLSEYQAKLVELEERGVDDVDSLIKLSEQLSKVQSDIEYAQGEKAKLLQRTKYDLLEINLSSKENESFGGPISSALSDFFDDLSEGISTVITALAFIVPWLPVALIVFYLFLWVWRKARRK